MASQDTTTLASILVRHPQGAAPVGIQAASALCNNPVQVRYVPKKDVAGVEATLIPSGDVLKGDFVVARFIARIAKSNIIGSDAVAQTQVDEWIDFASAAITDAAKIENALTGDYIVGNELTLADIALFVALKKSDAKIQESAKIAAYLTKIESNAALAPVLSAKKADNGKKAAANNKKAAAAAGGKVEKNINVGWQGSMDLGLENAEEGKVVTRFPPEPSGYLHIGHMKAALLNNYYARKYNGRLILRFDDTNPSKEKESFVKNIEDDLKRIEIIPDMISYTSDHFDLILDYARKLIRSGQGYMDSTPKEQIGDDRENQVESKDRSNSVEENLRLFEEFVQGTEEGKKYILRGKIGMSLKNKVMRDPIFYRSMDAPHHRTGSKYKVYPLYDFACPIVDSHEGVTHALRSSEYHDRKELYYWVIKALDLKHVQIEHFSRLNYKYTLLSKRKLQRLVDYGKVSGWDDPSFPTVQGILRQGMTVEALKKVILAQGASKVITNMEMEKLWAINKQIIDDEIPRYSALPSARKVPLELTNFSPEGGVERKSVPKHRKNPALGDKTLYHTQTVFLDSDDLANLALNEEITLLNWGNTIIREIVRGDDNKITKLVGELHLAGDFKTTSKKLHWVPSIPSEEPAPVALHYYGYLITKEKMEEDDDLDTFTNPKIHELVAAIGDPSLKTLAKGQRLQLERTGYFIVDKAFGEVDQQVHLVAIPDGRKTDVYKRG